MCHDQITNKKGMRTQGRRAAILTETDLLCESPRSLSQSTRQSTVSSRAQGGAAAIVSNHRPRRQDERTITHTQTHAGADGTPQFRGKRAPPMFPERKDSISEGDGTRHPAKAGSGEDTAEAKQRFNVAGPSSRDPQCCLTEPVTAAFLNSRP